MARFIVQLQMSGFDAWAAACLPIVYAAIGRQ